MKKLVIALLVLVGLLVVADFGIAAASEYQVSKKMRDELKLSDDPAVRINGFPFLYQAIDGDYRDIDVEANGISVGQLRDLQVTAKLNHVKVALSDLLAGKVDNVTVDKVDGKVTIRAVDVGRLLNIPDLRIEPATLEDRRVAQAQDAPKVDKTTAPVKLMGSTDLAGVKTKVTAIGTMSLVEGKIHIDPESFDVDNDLIRGELAPALKRTLQQIFSIKLDPGALPLTVVPTSVEVTSGALSVGGQATDVSFSGTGG